MTSGTLEESRRFLQVKLRAPSRESSKVSYCYNSVILYRHLPTLTTEMLAQRLVHFKIKKTGTLFSLI